MGRLFFFFLLFFCCCCVVLSFRCLVCVLRAEQLQHFTFNILFFYFYSACFFFSSSVNSVWVFDKCWLLFNGIRESIHFLYTALCPRISMRWYMVDRFSCKFLSDRVKNRSKLVSFCLVFYVLISLVSLLIAFFFCWMNSSQKEIYLWAVMDDHQTIEIADGNFYHSLCSGRV